MITVAADLLFEIGETVGIAGEISCFIHDQHPKMIARLDEFLRRLVMSRADRVATHFLQLCDAKVLQTIGNSHTNAGMILMIANALRKIGLPIEEQTFVCVKFHAANAEFSFSSVNHSAAARDGGDEFVKSR